MLFGSNTGDGIAQLGSNLLADPEKFYKELQEEFSTAGPRLMLGRTEWRQEDVNLAFRLRYTVSSFHKHLYPPGTFTQERTCYPKQWTVRWLP